MTRILIVADAFFLTIVLSRYNLSAPAQFRSKEITKTNVVDDMVASNHLLYAPGEHPDHLVVIK